MSSTISHKFFQHIRLNALENENKRIAGHGKIKSLTLDCIVS